MYHTSTAFKCVVNKTKYSTHPMVKYSTHPMVKYSTHPMVKYSTHPSTNYSTQQLYNSAIFSGLTEQRLRFNTTSTITVRLALLEHSAMALMSNNCAAKCLGLWTFFSCNRQQLKKVHRLKCFASTLLLTTATALCSNNTSLPFPGLLLS